MTSQITAPTSIGRFMAALSTAEHVTADSPVAPYRVCLEPNSDWGYVPGSFEWRIGVLLQFESVAEVARFAEALHVVVAERDHGGSQTYTFADGELNGIPFRAWALVDAKSSAVAA
ncbi:hypothetical protein [Streptomyces sp. NPDC102476]|uniref:hypothetical protein n=1 Tax=Streptomyces sp. NPDC102476 TaxID=3366181 RepID=UPI00382BFD8E